MKLSQLRFPIKTKLTVATLIPLAVSILFCALAGTVILNAKVSGQAQEKARNDLNVAREAYHNELSRVADVVRLTAAIGSTAPAVEGGNREALAEILTPVRLNERLDMMTAVDAYGKVVYRAANPLLYGDVVTDNLFVARALKGETVTGTSAVPWSRLALEGSTLLLQARKGPGAETVGGLFLMAAVPVRDRAGNVSGAICGGVLLNNNTAVAEKIRGTVYEGVKSQGREPGNASIYLGGVRVAGKAASPGSPADDRLAGQVYKKVVLGDSSWVERANSVDGEAYLAAYQPLRSLQGIPIGALYVGMKEREYSSGTTNMALLLSTVVLLSGLFGVAVSGVLGKRLAQPVKELAVLARRLAAGEREVRSDIVSPDEIGDLAGSFNDMSRALREREDHIIELNQDLERKVELRTAELEEKNRLLVQTREELLRVEKLAAIGELAAGVAHEINNPMAIIRGNTELLQLSLPESDPNREEVDTIFSQVKRVERIVSNLLKFARQERREQGTVRLNELLHETVTQIRHQEPLERIKVQERYAGEVALVSGDSGQLRQVFTNLVLNAVQAMPKGGVLTVESLPGPQEGFFQVRIADTGIGIPADSLRQIFNPFFTTKATGTGLGLSVSYGIVKEHGGTIEVASRQGEGTTFSVTLPG